MRVRKTGSANTGQVISTDGLIGVPSVTTLTTQQPVFSDKAQIIDEKHPEFFASAKAGKILMGPCTIDRHNLRNKTGVAVFEPLTISGSTWSGRKYEGDIAAYCSDTTDLEPQWFKNDVILKESEVVNRAFSKAYSSTATLLVTAAEMHKTVSMVKRPFGQARDLLARILLRKKTLMFRGLKAAEASAKAWLEYRMGWKPILYDLSNIAKAVEKQLTQFEEEQRTVYRSATQAGWSGSTYYSSSMLSPASTQVIRQLTSSYRISAGVILKEVLYDDPKDIWTKTFGVQLHDVAPAAWELMGYSFVIDRFIGVQTWLEAIQPRPRTEVLGSWQTTVRHAESKTATIDMTMTVTLKGVPTFYRRFPNDSIVNNTFGLVRKVGVSPSTLPLLVSRDLSVQQHADHAALILGQLYGLFPEMKFKNFGRKV